MSILSLDASQSVKLTLMKDVSHCFIRSDKLGGAGMCWWCSTTRRRATR